MSEQNPPAGGEQSPAATSTELSRPVEITAGMCAAAPRQGDPTTSITPPAAPVEITADMCTALPDQRYDFEKGMSCRPSFSIMTIAVCTAVFAWELWSGALESEAAIINAGALSRELVLKGQVWRLFSCMFLHGGFNHIIGNCIMLFILGMTCEHAYGRLETIKIYFIGGIVGSLFSMMGSPGPSVGASGAIFALAGAAVVFFFKYKKTFRMRDNRVGVFLIIWSLYTIAIGFTEPMIDNFAHIGGMIGGAFIGWIAAPALIANIKISREPYAVPERN